MAKTRVLKNLLMLKIKLANNQSQKPMQLILDGSEITSHLRFKNKPKKLKIRK